MEKLLKKQNHQLVFIIALAVLANPYYQNSAKAETTISQCDPILILLDQYEMPAQLQKTNEPQKNNEKITQGLPLVAIEPHEMLPKQFLPDTNCMLLNFANFEAAIEQPEETASKKIPDESKTNVINSLVKESVSSVISDPGNQSKQTLSNLIKQINATQLVTRQIKPQVNKESSPEEKGQQTQLTESIDPNEHIESEPPLAEQTKQQNSDEILTPEIVEKINQLINQSAKVQEPQLLADMLYSSGYFEQAAYFYDVAAKDQTQSENYDDNDKTWLLIQKALCLYHKNPQQALKIYTELVSQYPGSPWSQLVQSRESLANWLYTEQPKELIDECKKELIRKK